MTDNPYAPPKAEVAERAAVAPTVRPREITRAVCLLWALWVIDIVDTAFEWNGQVASRGLRSVLWEYGLVYGLSALVYVRLLKGSPWARIAQALVALVGVTAISLMAVRQVVFGVPIPGHGLAEALLMIAGNAYAAWLLFTSPGKEWFRKRVG